MHILLLLLITLSRSTFRANFDDGADFGQHTATQILVKFSPSHSGAGFGQNFDSHTATQMHPPKFCEENLGPQNLFETVTVEQGFMIEKDFLNQKYY